jgi:type VI secretion system protein ImpA
VQRLAAQILEKKLEVDPDEAPAAVEQDVVEEEPVAEAEETSDPVVTQAPKKKAARGSLAAEPVDADDAIARVAGAAKFLRAANAGDPAPFLMLRGLRWGELRASNPPDANIFEPPPTETRQTLKRLLNEGSYAEVIELAEEAMATPAGRAWLDLQRYVVTALEYESYNAVADAIKSELKALVRDFPDLVKGTLLDDTPVANTETQEWIATFAAEPEPAAAEAPVQQTWAEPVYDDQAESATDEEKAPDTYELAMDAARSGRGQDALELLTAEIGHQTSGRGRFQRKLQLAQICLSIGQHAIASSVLQELAATIDDHKLESWESPELVAHALALLLGTLEQDEEADRKAIYARICRLDPVQAMRCASAAGAR